MSALSDRHNFAPGQACNESTERQHGWHPIREFWESTDDEMGPEKTEDALLELRACAEQKKFDILLVPRFVCIGRVPEESFYAAAFFERMGIEVWDTIEGRIVSVF